MAQRVFSLIITGLCFGSAGAQVPQLAGQVTEASSSTNFEVNGKNVICDAKTDFRVAHGVDPSRISWSEKPYMGAPLLVFGREDHHTHVVYAKRVIFAPADQILHGQGIVEQLLNSNVPGSILLRADGYPILVQAATTVLFAKPLKSLKDIGPNVWLQYQGRQRPDGVLVADKVSFRPNDLSDREEKLRDRYTYDPATIASDAHQNALVRAVRGIDPSQLQPYPDAAMQQRVIAIGEKLIPKCQKELPAADPNRISFQFEVIDGKDREGLGFPSGVILIPRDAVERAQTDDELAGYIASSMSAVIEKQRVRNGSKKGALDAAEIGGLIALTPAFMGAVSKKQDLEIAEEEQRMRESLSLVNDAGYDVIGVPRIWWRLASADPKPLSEVPIPPKAEYAYAVIGSTWRDTAWLGR